MKQLKIMLALVFAFAFTATNAQISAESTGTWKLKSLKSNLGAHGDHFFKMNLDYMEGRINDDSYQRLDLTGYQAADYVMNTSGVNINLGAIFSRTPKNTGFGKYEALEVNLGVHTGREVMIDFIDQSHNNGFDYYNSITYCDLQNEINLTGVYRRGISFFNVMNIYTGIGLSAGSTFASQMWIFGNTGSGDLSYGLQESVVGRAFIPVGGEIVLMDKLALNAEARLGTGYSHSFGHGGFGNLNYSVLAGFAWNI
jgi:hypothetical protein